VLGGAEDELCAILISGAHSARLQDEGDSSAVVRCVPVGDDQVVSGGSGEEVLTEGNSAVLAVDTHHPSSAHHFIGDVIVCIVVVVLKQTNVGEASRVYLVRTGEGDGEGGDGGVATLRGELEGI
jgi:hypothetical protein